MKSSISDHLAFFRQFHGPFLDGELYDMLQDTVFFVKDIKGRYMAVNQTLVLRCGRRRKQDLIGKTAADMFPAPFGARYAEQDRAVLHTGKPVQKALELHLYPDGSEGWCLTWKLALRNADGQIIGLVGISRDINPPIAVKAEMEKLTRILSHIKVHIDKPLRAGALSKMVGFSPYQLDRRLRAAFGMPLRVLISRERIDKACALLRNGGTSISQIALECGYTDQAAFTRSFRRMAGMTPSSYIRASNAQEQSQSV